MKKPKIAIAVPYNGAFNPEWVENTYGPIRYMGLDWCDKLPILSKAPSLPVARDMLIKQSIELGCNYTFFLDTDLIFETPKDPNIALRILYQCLSDNPDTRIVSGLYRAKKKEGFTWAMWTKPPEGAINPKDPNSPIKGYAPIEQWTGNWIECRVAGLGCCLIDNSIFKKIPDPLFRWDGRDDISEDFYFMERAREHGFITKVFTDVRLSHITNVKVMSDGSLKMVEM